MRRFAYAIVFALLLVLVAVPVRSQWLPSQGVLQILPGTNVSITPTDGYGIVTINATGASAGGSSGQIQYNNGGVLGGFTMNGDATLNTASGAITFATVNSTPGTFAYPSSVTVNGKGLITNIVAGSAPGGGTVTSFSAGTLSPLFTTSVATATTTPALSFTLSNAGANTFFGNNTGSSAAPLFMSAIQAANILPTFTNTQQGLVPAGGGGSTSVYLNGAGTFTTPPGGVSGSGATNEVTIWSGSSTITGDNSFQYNTGSHILSVGLGASGGGGINLYSNASNYTELLAQNLSTNTIFTFPSVTYTGPSVQAGTGAVEIVSNTGLAAYSTSFFLTNGGATITHGTNGGTGGSEVFNGSTSGSNTIQVPAAAGTGTTFTLPAASLTWPAANASGTLTNNGSGTLSWAAGSSITGSGANTEVAYWNGTSSLTGSSAFTFGSSLLTLTGTNLKFVSGFGGATTIQPVSAPGYTNTFILPDVNVSEVTTQAAQPQQTLVSNTSGTRSYISGSGFGGDGSDGAITTWTKPLINATTVAVSSSTGPTNYAKVIVNATSTVAFNSGAVVSNTQGYGPSAASATVVQQAQGPGGGQNSISALIGAGGGAGGFGGGTGSSGGSGGGVGSSGGFGGQTTTQGTSFNFGSGGGSSNFSGGIGGGGLIICAVGAISTASGASVACNGSAGTAASTTAHGGAGGGGGGYEAFYSQTSLTLAAGTCSVTGGAGGAGDTTGDGGGGGGGGGIFGMSPSNSNSLVTATACAGGTGGGTGSGTVGSGGFAGNIIMVTGTPTAPLISKMEKGGYQRFIAYLKRCDYEVDEHGYQSYVDQLASVIADSQSEYVCFMAPDHKFGFGITNFGDGARLYAIRPRSYKDVA